MGAALLAVGDLVAAGRLAVSATATSLTTLLRFSNTLHSSGSVAGCLVARLLRGSVLAL